MTEEMTKADIKHRNAMVFGSNDLLAAMLRQRGMTWPCGHARHDRNTHRVGVRNSCRECRVERWNKGFRISLARRKHLAKGPNRKIEIARMQRERSYQELVHPKNGKLPFDALLQEVARAFKLTTSEVKGRGRKTVHVAARAVLIRILRERGLSFPRIGNLLGGRDHSSIINSVEKFEKYATLDERVVQTFMRLRDRKAAINEAE